jgi:hypothetical protein
VASFFAKPARRLATPARCHPLDDAVPLVAQVHQETIGRGEITITPVANYSTQNYSLSKGTGKMVAGYM